jgi:hypothetical protein
MLSPRFPESEPFVGCLIEKCDREPHFRRSHGFYFDRHFHEPGSHLADFEQPLRRFGDVIVGTRCRNLIQCSFDVVWFQLDHLF